MSGAFSDDLQTATVEQIGKASAKLGEIADELTKAREAGTADRIESLAKEQAAQAGILTELKTKHDTEVAEAAAKAQTDAVNELLAWSKTAREPSKAAVLGGFGPQQKPRQFDIDTRGAFLYGVHEANARDSDRQAAGKAILAALRGETPRSEGIDGEGKAVLDDILGAKRPDAQAYAREEAWGKATLGTTDALGGWIIPNAIVDDFITPAQVDDIYRSLMTVVPGVTAFAVDIPFRSAARTRAAVALAGSTKENLDLAYNGYTATMYTPARSPLAGGGVLPTAAVISATSYWTMVSQGTDTAGFFFAPAGGPLQVRPGTLLTPWGLPVYPDADADLEGTAAVIDNLVVANWKKFKVYFGQTYRVDSSDQAGTRWDTNLTGFRGEEEMGFDARPAVYAGYAQMITDVTP